MEKTDIDDACRARLEAELGPQSTPLLARMHAISLLPGEVLLVEGAPTGCLYLLCEGALEVLVEEEGRQLLLARVSPGEWVGEVAVIEPGPGSATVRATGGSILLVLDHADIQQLRAEDPATATLLLARLLAGLAARLRASMERLVQGARP